MCRTMQIKHCKLPKVGCSKFWTNTVFGTWREIDLQKIVFTYIIFYATCIKNIYVVALCSHIYFFIQNG
jgi:hypothetical protein